MNALAALIEKPARLVAGVMSGTSLDGVDVVVARLEGSGRALTLDVRAAHSEPYPEALRALVLRNAAVDTSDVRRLSSLNARLAIAYAEAVQHALDGAGIARADLDLVGSHGQTVWHAPVPEDCAGVPVASTLQIGDPSMLAKYLGVPVVGDFRVGDVALGGQGAPLVPYFDFVRFAHPTETRGLLNLGGIANLTVLPAGADAGDVYAFDTGPANMVIDRLVQRLFDQPYDADGAIAATGEVDETLLMVLLDDPYLRVPPPKSTGRELYDEAYIDQLLADAGFAHHAPDEEQARNLIATATAFTAHSIALAYHLFVEKKHPLDVLIPSGGGRRNATLLQMLADRFPGVPVRPVDAYGVDSDTKEALCFAVLAHETLNGVPTNLPRVTGAARATVLGKICLG